MIPRYGMDIAGARGTPWIWQGHGGITHKSWIIGYDTFPKLKYLGIIDNGGIRVTFYSTKQYFQELLLTLCFYFKRYSILAQGIVLGLHHECISQMSCH